MSELKRKILDAIAWIALVVGIIMILWRVFGNSPTDLAVISPFIVLGLVKIWSNNNTIKDVGYQVKLLSNNTKSSFEKVRGDMSRIESKIDSLLNKNKRGK